MSYETAHGYTVPATSDPIAEGADVIAANALQLEERVKSLDSGTAIVTPVANTPTSLRVNFNFTFPVPPHVVATPDTGVIETTVRSIAVQSIDTTGFRLWVFRTNTTATPCQWIAHG